MKQGYPGAEEHHSPAQGKVFFGNSKKPVTNVIHIYCTNRESIETQRRKWNSPTTPPPRDNPCPQSSLCSECIGPWCNQPPEQTPTRMFHLITCFLRTPPPPLHTLACAVVSNLAPHHLWWPRCIRDLNAAPLLSTLVMSVFFCLLPTLCDTWGPSPCCSQLAMGLRVCAGPSYIGSSFPRSSLSLPSPVTARSPHLQAIRAGPPRKPLPAGLTLREREIERERGRKESERSQIGPHALGGQGGPQCPRGWERRALMSSGLPGRVCSRASSGKSPLPAGLVCQWG